MQRMLFCVALLGALAGCDNTLVTAVQPTVIDFGDSVSKGYAEQARRDINGTVDLRHNPWDATGLDIHSATYNQDFITRSENDGCAGTMLNVLRAELPGSHYTVILYNAGIHDMQQNISKAGCGRTTLADYRQDMEQIATLLEAHADIVIWVDTTDIPTGATYMPAGEQVVFNPVAEAVAREHGFYILNTATVGQRPHNVHFTFAGYEALGKQVSDCVLTALAGQETSDCHR